MADLAGSISLWDVHVFQVYVHKKGISHDLPGAASQVWASLAERFHVFVWVIFV